MPQRDRLTLAQIVMWGLIPLVTIVFSAGAGWWRLSELEQRVAAQQSRVDKLNDNMIAVCIATGADCQR